MPREGDERGRKSENEGPESVFDRQMLSDLFVNAVPVVILGVLLVGFQLLTPGSGGEPLLGMHLALVGGVVVVSYVAARVIANAEGELRGPNGVNSDDTEDR